MYVEGWSNLPIWCKSPFNMVEFIYNYVTQNLSRLFCLLFSDVRVITIVILSVWVAICIVFGIIAYKFIRKRKYIIWGIVSFLLSIGIVAPIYIYIVYKNNNLLVVLLEDFLTIAWYAGSLIGVSIRLRKNKFNK